MLFLHSPHSVFTSQSVGYADRKVLQRNAKQRQRCKFKPDQQIIKHICNHIIILVISRGEEAKNKAKFAANFIRQEILLVNQELFELCSEEGNHNLSFDMNLQLQK